MEATCWVVFQFSFNFNKITRKIEKHVYGKLKEDSLGYPYVCLDEGFDQ